MEWGCKVRTGMGMGMSQLGMDSREEERMVRGLRVAYFGKEVGVYGGD
jgi:hypothetical protein